MNAVLSTIGIDLIAYVIGGAVTAVIIWLVILYRSHHGH